MELVKLMLTAVLSVVSLFFITKIMGHKQVAQLDFFDYVSGITIGSIGAELATELEKPYKPLLALCIWGSVSIILNLCTSKLPRTRKYINGTPTILMNNGRIYRKNMKKARLDLSEFMLLCREQGYFDLKEIGCAVFEHNGRLSILPRAENRPVTAKDLGIAVKGDHIGVELIMDGRIIDKNLHRVGRDINWLNKRLTEQGYKGANEIFLAIFHPDEDRLTVYPTE